MIASSLNGWAQIRGNRCAAKVDEAGTAARAFFAENIDNGTSNIFIDIIANDTTGANMGPTSNGSQVIGGNVPTIVKNASATNAGGVQSSAKQIGTSSGGANASGLQMIAATPGFALENTGGAADAKWWDCIVAGGSFVCRTLTDAFGLGSNWMTVNRTAGPVTSMSFGINGNVQTMPTTTGTLGNVIVSGTSTFTTTAATTGTCQTTVTTAATGALTTDAIEVAFATAPVAATDGMLILQKYVTAGNVNFMRCNPTAGTITPTALVLNWRVIR